MAKIVKDNWLFQVEKVDGDILYSAHYEVEAEGVKEKRGMPIEFSRTEETQIKNFINNVVRPKVEEHEIGD